MCNCCGLIDELAVFTNLAAFPVFDKNTELTLIGWSSNSYGTIAWCIALTGNEVNVCAFWNVGECGTTIEGNEGIAVFVCTLEGIAA